MEEIVYQLRSDRPFVRAAGDKWLAKLCLAVFVVVLVSVNGTSASNYEGWHAWEVVGTDNGWQNAWPVAVMDTSGWNNQGWQKPAPKYKVRTVTQVVKKVPKKVTRTYTTYEDDHDPWISLYVNKRLRRPTIILNGWAKDGKFGLNVNIH